MPRSDLNHNWGNRQRNMPQFNSCGIPEERLRLINQARNINETETERFERNRQERRINGNYNPINPASDNNNNSEVPILFVGGNYTIPNARVVDWGAIYNSFNTQVISTIVGSTQEKYKYINVYNYIPQNFKFFSTNDEQNKEQYFGIELEVDNGGENDEKAKQILDYMNSERIYIKHDGSLDKGFEIVTMPMTYNYHLKEMDYRGLFELLVGLNYKSHDTKTCGLHIHINKYYFGKNKTVQDFNISKLLYLFEKFWNNLVVFSRRDNMSLNKWASRYGMSENESMFDVFSKAKYKNKYCSVNLGHKDTVEFRLFKGTLKYETFIATLQLVKRLCEIAKEIDIESIQTLKWEDLFVNCDFELQEYLISKKLLKNEVSLVN